MAGNIKVTGILKRAIDLTFSTNFMYGVIFGEDDDDDDDDRCVNLICFYWSPAMGVKYSC